MTFLQKLRASVLGFHGYSDLAEAKDKTEGLGYMALLLLIWCIIPALRLSELQRNILAFMQSTITQEPGLPGPIGEQIRSVFTTFSAMSAYALPITYAQLYVQSFIGKCVGAFFLAFVGRWYARRRNRLVKFELAWRLGLHAATLPMCIGLLQVAFMPTTVSQALSPTHDLAAYALIPVYWAVAILYEIKGLQAFWTREDARAASQVG